MKKVTDLLLDVNVLVALAWPNHQFHAAAQRRLRLTHERWATCAITQLGFIRVSSTPALVGAAQTPGEAARLLAAMTTDSRHVYLGSLPSPLDFGDRQFDQILGSRQVTDVYLVNLARTHGVKLLTFDSKLRHLADGGAAMEILGL